MRVLAVVAACWCCMCSAAGSRALASDRQVQKAFEERYQAWRAWKEKHFLLSTFTGSPEFDEIVNLGLPALPYVIEKMDNNPEDFHLGQAVRRISKRRFERADWPKGKLAGSRTKARMYLEWWKVGRHKTGERFERLYGEWKRLKSAGKTQEAQLKFKSIVFLGIPVLPHVIDKLEEEPDLIDAAAQLTDGQVDKRWSPQQAKVWWENHRSAWEIRAETKDREQ